MTVNDETDDEITSSLVQQMAMEGGSFTFLDNPEEDIYFDDDLKVKY